LAVNINISNYEEFLLSAIDGELNGDETAALEAFMQEHPAIRKELALLQSTKLSPDAGMTFDAKEMLYKNASVLSATNYERFLLDYVDNELSVSEKRELEALIGQHPHIQKDLSLLQVARLTPDLSVTFENKASLYRKERTRVRPLWWWSAAAAVVVGLTVWLLPGQRPGKDEGAQVAVNQPATNGSSSTVQQPAGQPAGTPSLADASKPASPAEDASEAAADEGREAASIARTTNNAGKNTSQSTAIAQSNTDNRTNKRPASDAATDEPKAETGIDRIPDNRLTALAKMPQPASTSGEVVQQLQEKTAQQEKILGENVTAIPEKTAVMANAEKISDAIPAAAAAPANVKGELVVAVTMNGDSKLLNGVANVARFLSRKKK
jgi:anti-sigma factor RsiW